MLTLWSIEILMKTANYQLNDPYMCDISVRDSYLIVFDHLEIWKEISVLLHEYSQRNMDEV